MTDLRVLTRPAAESLTTLREATTLHWHRWTVFRPGGWADGTLITDTGQRYPLDITLPDHHHTAGDLTADVVGVAVIDPANLNDVHNAVRAWCRRFLGRDDVTFGGDQ